MALLRLTAVSGTILEFYDVEEARFFMDNCLKKYLAHCGPLQTGTSPSAIRLFDLVAEPIHFPGKWRIPGPVIGRKMSGDASSFAKILEYFADKDDPVTPRNKETNT